MSPAALVWILNGIGLLLGLLVHLRLRGEDGGGGRYRIGRGWIWLHITLVFLAVGTWAVYLLIGREVSWRPLLGIVSLGMSWMVALCGLVLLLRWLPAKGRHAEAAHYDRWSQGPMLSVLAHSTMFVGVIILTGVYLVTKV